MGAFFTRLRQSDILLATGVIGLIVLFFVPLPAPALDFLFAINITLGLVTLLTVLFINKALEFTAFPMLLLIATTFRLALNVASTRLILSDGHQSGAAAGKIIEAFGSVVVGGNFIIGLVIFLILIIVNFVVITKGSGRIAEVAARFTLDSLPGKQMAIDADLNAGLINEDQARERRKELENETGFFGAMDGASKFVRGDAIAGLIITALNLAVGMIVGTTQHGMSLMESADRYMLLTVGDGLVAYIPALTISIAAGMLVAKSGTMDTAGKVFFQQLSQNPVVLYVGAAIMFLISLMPNMPVLPFWILAGAMAAGGYYATKYIPIREQEERQRRAEASSAGMKAAMEGEEIDGEAAQTPKPITPPEEPISSVLHVDTLRLELGYGLLSLIDESKGGRLSSQIKAMRRQMAKDIGFIVPSIRIQDNMQLAQGDYSLFIKDINAGSGALQPGKLMAMDPTGSATPINGQDTIEPTFGLPAKWIDENQKEDAQFNGYTVVDTSTVIVTHLTEVIKDNLPELLTRTELDKLLEETSVQHGKLIDELIPEKISKGVLQKVMQNLLAERVSVRDLPTILEALSDFSAGARNITMMTEHVRNRLARQISSQHVAGDGAVPIITLSPTWEKEFNGAIVANGEEKQLAMAPDKVQSFLKSARDTIERQLMSGTSPIMLTSPNIRPFVRTLTERTMPTIAILSQAEIHPKIKIKTVGSV